MKHILSIFKNFNKNLKPDFRILLENRIKISKISTMSETVDIKSVKFSNSLTFPMVGLGTFR